MGNSSSSSSSVPPIDFKNIELDQRIALFAKYLENSNKNKNHNHQQAYFWTCQVTEQNTDKSDAQVECAIGVPPNYSDNQEVEDAPPNNSSMKMWLKNDHGSLYQLQKATKEDEERKFFSIFPPNDQRLRKVWIDENTGKLNLQMPKGLFENGIQVGPHEEDVAFFKQMRNPKEVDQAVSPKNGWRGKETFAFQLYDFIVVEAAMRRSMEDLKN